MSGVPVRVHLTYMGRPINGPADRPEGIVIRKWRAILRETNRQMAYHWHSEFSDLHFGSNARRRYGAGAYKQRTSLWLARKLGIKAADVNRIADIKAGEPKEVRQRKRQVARQTLVSQKGGVNYNVFTGNLRQMVKNATFRAFPSRFRIEMPAPAYVPARKKDQRDPDIRKELTTVLPSELKSMQQIGQRVLVFSVRHVLRTGDLPPGIKG
jgi:hypothetical protein